MTLLHGTDTEEFLLDLDPRITYSTGRDSSLVVDDPFDIQVRQEFFPEELQVFITGSLPAPDDTGIMRWSLQFRADNLLAITDSVRITPAPFETVDVSPLTIGSPNLTSLIPLVDSGLSFQICLTPVFTIPLPPDVKLWIFFDGFARPRRSLSELEQGLRSLGEPVLQSIFGVGTPLAAREPFLTFRNLWETHPEQPYRLSGILLATIYQIERTRNAAP
jgi:hypothetical protein